MKAGLIYAGVVGALGFTGYVLGRYVGQLLVAVYNRVNA